MTTKKTVVDRFKSTFQYDSGGAALIDELLRKRTWTVEIGADTAASSGSIHFLLKAPDDLEDISVSIVSFDDITENDTNYATLEVNSSDGAAGALVPMMTAVTTKITGGIDIDAETAVAFTLTTDTLDEDDWLVLEITKSGAGVQLPPITVNIVGWLV